MKTRQSLSLAAVILLGMVSLAGCDGSDDVRMHNHYPFPVQASSQYKDAVTHQPTKQVICVVPAHGVSTFQGAGYKGGALGDIRYETTAGKVLGKLSKTKPGTTRTGTNSMGGGGVWDVTVP